MPCTVSKSACHWCAIVIETADFIEGLLVIDSKQGLIVFQLITVAWCDFRFALTDSFRPVQAPHRATYRSATRVKAGALTTESDWRVCLTRSPVLLSVCSH